MLFSSDLVDCVGEEVLSNKGDADVRSDSEVKSGETDP